jgi:hypothetical protein
VSRKYLPLYVKENSRYFRNGKWMLKRLQNATVIALALCFLIGFGAEVWRASNTPNPKINQSSSTKKKNDTNAEAQKETAEEAIARYNKWLVVFTGVLAIATVGLGIATVGLYLTGEKQIRIAKEFADAARKAADASTTAADASIRQAKIAENALVQLERPYVFIFGVRGIKQDPESQEFYVEYTIANYGKMPAIIEAPHIGFEISDSGSPPMPPRLFDGHSLLTSPILQAGEWRENIREYVPQGMTGPDILARIEHKGVTEASDIVPTFNVPENFDVFFRAFIAYRGPLTAGHQTAALWLYNHAVYEFAVRGGSEDNYLR